MQLSWAAIVGALLGLALVLSACGDDRSAAAGEPTSPPAAGTSAASAAPPAKPAAPRGGACRSQLRGFLAAMSALRERLARGSSYDQYLAAVRRLRGAYDGIEAARLPIGCLLASGGPGERAFNFYVDAANVWGDCLATVSCDTASIEPELQRKWALASAQLSRAQRGLPRASRG
jgi:hypothetical protein